MISAVICAAGVSKRMGGVKKEYRLLPGSCLTVLGAAVSTFASVPSIDVIVIAVPDDSETGEAAARNAIPPELLAGKNSPPVKFVCGGKNRQASVFNALTELSTSPPGYVLIHDGARPWVSPGLIGHIIAEVKNHGAVVPIVPLTETPKELEIPKHPTPNSLLRQSRTPTIKRHLKRSAVGVAQTPQAFAFNGIFAAHKEAALKEDTEGVEFTDDAEIWAAFCGSVAAVPGEPENRKITFPEDLC